MGICLFSQVTTCLLSQIPEAIFQEETASSSARRGLDCILGKMGCLGIGTGCPEKRWGRYSWKCPKGTWMWHMGMGFSGEHVSAGLMVGHDLRSFPVLVSLWIWFQVHPSITRSNMDFASKYPLQLGSAFLFLMWFPVCPLLPHSSLISSPLWNNTKNK